MSSTKNPLAVALLPALLFGSAASVAQAGEGPQIALASHSYHELNLSRLLPRAAKLGVERIELRDRHFSVFSSDRDLERLRSALANAGIRPISTFTAYFSADEQANRRIFEVAQALGLEYIAAVPHPDLLPMLSSLVDEYGVGLALHNGEPEEPYGTPEKIAAVLERYPNIDAVADIGYYARQGADPAAVVRGLAGRLREVHAKDLVSLSMPEKDQPYTVVGSGLVDWPAIAAAMEETGYEGYVTVEYTGDFRNYLEREPKIAASLGYLKGLLE